MSLRLFPIRLPQTFIYYFKLSMGKYFDIGIVHAHWVYKNIFKLKILEPQNLEDVCKNSQLIYFGVFSTIFFDC